MRCRTDRWLPDNVGRCCTAGVDYIGLGHVAFGICPRDTPKQNKTSEIDLAHGPTWLTIPIIINPIALPDANLFSGVTLSLRR